MAWRPAAKTRLLGSLLFNRQFAAASNQLAAIKELREKSGAPIAEVKSALTEAGWDLGEAYQQLRKKGLAAASKKASRHAAEGLIGVASDRGIAAAVEVNSETDFVARNPQFMDLVRNIAHAALQAPAAASSDHAVDATALQQQNLPTGTSVADAVAEVAGSVRENIKFRRAHRLQTDSGIVASYIHTSLGPSLGRMTALVALESSKGALPADKAEQIYELGQKIAMHAVAMRPQFLDRDSVSAEALEAEKQVLREQAAKSGKPANIVEKMIQGRLSKFYEEVCLLEQKFVMDDSKKIKDVVEEAAKKHGMDLQLTGYVRLQVGEGLQTQAKDLHLKLLPLSNPRDTLLVT